MQILESYSWPGNVREFRNVIERAVVLSSGQSMREEDLSLDLATQRNDSH